MGVVPSHRDPDWSEQCTRTVAAHLISTRSVYGDSGGDGAGIKKEVGSTF